MKKLLTGIVVLSMASMAFAVPAFEINGGVDVQVLPGASVTLPVTVTGGVANTAGMTLNLMTTDNAFIIYDIDVDSAPGGLFAGSAGTGANLFLNRLYPDDVPTWAGVADVTAAATVDAGPKSVVALVTINVDPAATIGTIGVLATALPEELGGASVLKDASGNLLVGDVGSINLSVIPEPATALLLLAAVPFLRRRHA